MPQPRKSGPEKPFLFEDGTLQRRVRQSFHDMVGDPAAEWVAPKCCAVIARHDRARDILAHDSAADGKPVAKRFRRGDDIRVSGCGQGRMRPQRACAGEAALDLIVDEHGADLVAAVAKRGEKSGRRGIDAAFALDGLDDHTRGILGDVRGQLIRGDTIGDGVEARQERGEGGLVFGIRCRRQGAHGAAVEGVVEG